MPGGVYRWVLFLDIYARYMALVTVVKGVIVTEIMALALWRANGD